MKCYIDTGLLHDDLRAELQGYALCSLDGTMGETPHRDISSEFRRAPGSSIVAVASFLRQQQNLRMGDSFAQQPLSREKCWRNWKMVVSPFGDGILRAKTPRITQTKALGRIYRLGALGLHEWNWLEPKLKNPRLLDVGWRKLDKLQKVKVEYLRSVLTDGAILSVGFPETIVIEEIERGRGSFAPFFLPHAVAQSGEWQGKGDFFQPLIQLGLKKFVVTKWSEEWHKMALPMMVQFYTKSDVRDNACLLMLQGEPVVVDAVELVPSTLLYDKLFEWTFDTEFQSN